MRTRRYILSSLLVTLVLLVAVPITAHETENTHVLITFTEHTYQIDILNDPDWLWLMLSPEAGLIVPDFEARDRQLAELTDRFAEELLVLFDGEPIDIDRVEYIGPVEHDPTAPMGWGEPGMFRLSGTVPEGAERFAIAYVAIENLVTRELQPWRVALVFGFGLLHGMGFAGVLSELGLPRSECVTALLTFNLGVEGGQLTVIALAFGAVFQVQQQDWYRRWVVVPASLAIAATRIVWTVQRVIG